MAADNNTADVVVVGLGAMGAATLYQLARRGVRAVGIDRYHPPHDRGSSHGETRITRQAIGEGAAYVPLALEAQDIWRALEAETGARLLLECGFLAIDETGGRAIMHGKPGFFDRTLEMARRFDIAHEILTPTETMRRFPAFTLRGGEQVYYEPGGGLVYAERCIATQLSLARALGARTRLNETVRAIRPTRDGVVVETGAARLHADHVVLAAGGWTPGLVGTPLANVRLLRQTLHWFAPAEPALFAADRFPTFTWAHGLAPEDSFYGFPMIPDGTAGVKIAGEQFLTAIDAPEKLARTVTRDEDCATYARHAAGRVTGLTGGTVAARACLYTNAPDGEFIIDRAPDDPRMLVVSACSGHGFKHSAAVGRHVADILTGGGPHIPEFGLDRRALAAIDLAEATA